MRRWLCWVSYVRELDLAARCVGECDCSEGLYVGKRTNIQALSFATHTPISPLDYRWEGGLSEQQHLISETGQSNTERVSGN